MSGVALRWRFFWSRRARWRATAALVFALVALLASLYLASPPAAQALLAQGLAAVGEQIGTTHPDMALAALVAVSALLSLACIVAPPARRQRYFVTSPALIPPVTVYLDAENQLSDAAIRPFTRFLMDHLGGRRADLLYFLDASAMAGGPKYKLLYRFGFRPIDVPHDPIGAGPVKEAVDKELAMHAYERALLGPPNQEFILITADAGYVQLIYRLVARGHRVQVWATPLPQAYRSLATFLDIQALDLKQVAPELAAMPAPGGPSRVRRKRHATPLASSASRREAPSETAILVAIRETRAAHEVCQRRARSEADRNALFRSYLGKLRPRLAAAGYNAGSWPDYWLDHLSALHVFEPVAGSPFLHRGATTPEDAARRLFAMAQAAAQATVRVAVARGDGRALMSEVATALASTPASEAGAGSAPLRRLLAPGDSRRAAHARYFVRCARAVGLLAFDDTPESLDVIAAVRLPDAAYRLDAHESSEVTEAVTSPNTINGESDHLLTQIPARDGASDGRTDPAGP